jgi:TRAP-type C4-dicarboxylate transport system permease large subunit
MRDRLILARLGMECVGLLFAWHQWEHFMNRNPLGIVLLIIGALLLIFGIMAADSLASSFSRLFSGTPTDKSVFLVIAGAVCLGAGLFMTAIPRKS